MKGIITKLLFIGLLNTVFVTSTEAQFKDIVKKAKKTLNLDDPSNIASGLKEALEVGVDDAVSSLAKENGYFDSPYKVLVPEEAQSIVKKVKIVPGFENVERDLIAKMNQAAELAAKKAGPIFLKAIKQMSFKDATQILMGEQDAATQYLDKSARKELYDTFMPVIQSALDEVNARTYWTSVVNAYNTIPFTKKLNPELDDHVNQAALTGMFGLIAKKEEGIRQDVGLRTSPLLKEVFAQQDKK